MAGGAQGKLANTVCTFQWRWSAQMPACKAWLCCVWNWLPEFLEAATGHQAVLWES